ncbi:unnamed protein product [Sympodiomycopsis kandeliae]
METELPITPPRSSSSNRSSSTSHKMDPVTSLPDLAADLPDLNALPQDIESLQTLLQSSHASLLSRNQTITSLHSQLDHITNSHDTILTRSAEWKDELESLRTQVPQLKHQLMQTTAEKSELEDRVKDLRVRSEESRRAIMRLQGEQRTKADNRRSVAWNPHDIPAGLAEEHDPSLSSSSSSAAAGPSSTASKRSTIMFGSAAANKSRHTRTASGGRSSHFQLEPTQRYAAGSDQGDNTASADPVADSLATLSANSANTSRRSSSLAPPSSSHLMGLNINGAALSSSPASSSAALSTSPSSGAPAATTSAPQSAASSSGGARPLTLMASPNMASSAATSPVLDSHSARWSPPTASEEQDSTPSSRPVTIMSGGSNTSQSRVMQIVRQKETELERLHSEMRLMRVRLDEALDAKRASDDCLKALKEFIGEGGPEGEAEARQALRGVKLPPLPTDETQNESADQQAQEKTNTSTWTATKWAQSLMSSSKKGNPTEEGQDASTMSSPPTSTATLPSVSGSSSNANANANAATGLSTISSFFQRSPAGGSSATAATSPAASATTAPPVPPKASPRGDPDDLPAAGMNRLSTWFKRVPTSSGTSTEEKVASPPFKSLEESTLQPIQLNSGTSSENTLSRKVSSDVSEDGATLGENGFVAPHFE